MDVNRQAMSNGALEGLCSARGPLWYLHILFYSIDDGASVQEVLTEISNQKTVPNIFVNKVHVGGCDRTFQVMMVIRHGPQHCVFTLQFNPCQRGIAVERHMGRVWDTPEDAREMSFSINT